MCCCCRRRPKQNDVASTQDEFQRLGGTYAHYDFMELMCPPNSISEKDAANIRKLARAMLDYDDEDVQVFLTYDIGHRPQDGSGCGPGLYFAAAILKLLYDKGIKCLCDLMFLDDAPREHMAAKLSSQIGKGRTLLVVQTKAWYECRHSLKEASVAATDASFKVMLIRFENELPLESEQWPNISIKNSDDSTSVVAVQSKLCTSEMIPPPPYTILEKPSCLMDLCVDLQLRKTPNTSQSGDLRDCNARSAQTLGFLSSGMPSVSWESCDSQSTLLTEPMKVTAPKTKSRPKKKTDGASKNSSGRERSVGSGKEKRRGEECAATEGKRIARKSDERSSRSRRASRDAAGTTIQADNHTIIDHQTSIKAAYKACKPPPLTLP